MKGTTYSKILVCSENSPTARKALTQACVLAKQFEAKLYLIYVVDNPSGIGLQMIDKSEFVKMFRKHGEHVLKEGDRLSTKNGIKAIKILKEGNVANEIIKFATKEKIDLITLGSRGLSRLPRFILGSVSNRIVNYAPCQVLIVK